MLASVGGFRFRPLNRGLIEIWKIGGLAVVVVVEVVEVLLGGMRVGHPFSKSQLRLMLPPRSRASWRSGGGATPMGILRLGFEPLGTVTLRLLAGDGVVVGRLTSWFLF